MKANEIKHGISKKLVERVLGSKSEARIIFTASINKKAYTKTLTVWETSCQINNNFAGRTNSDYLKIWREKVMKKLFLDPENRTIMIED